MAKVLISLLFLIINLIHFNSADFNIPKFNNDEHNNIYNLQKLDGSSLLNYRQRRQAGNSDLTTQYKSISSIQSSSTETPDNEHIQSSVPSQTNLTNNNINNNNNTDKTIVKPSSTDKQSLLGVDGAGQRKNYTISITTKPPIVSDPISETKKGTSVKKVQSNFKDSPPVLATDPVETIDDFFGNVDISEDEVEKNFKDNNYTLNFTEEHHVYYNSTTFVDKMMADSYWESFKNISTNNLLSTSHRRAMTVQLSFDFPFYGNPVRNVTVATGGFLYTGEYVHSWLAATQYIAPLMANFDSSLSNTSFVRYSDNGTAFTVVWENVYLQDKRDVGTFTFSATLHKNGDIVFAYFNVPMPIETIQDDKHPVKVGLSDAYIIDKVIFFARRKTIYEYHRVNFAGTEIKSNTIINLKALPTCLSYTTCQSCLLHETNFDCSWCPSLNKCSIGTDRKRQDWLLKGCDRTQIKKIETCPAVGEKGNDSGSSQNDSSDSINDNHNNNKSNSKSNDRSSRKDTSAEDTISKSSEMSNMAATSKKEEEKSNVGLVIGLMIPICLVMTILVWVFYAYRNPHTKSGQLLIQYRPTHWSWRRGEARYTAATIHM